MNQKNIIENFSDFTNQYSISKTLRFELKLEKGDIDSLKKLVALDEVLASDYNRAKKLADQYHRFFIDDVLNGISSDYLREDIDSYRRLYYDKKVDKKVFNDYKAKLREKIACIFREDPMFVKLFSEKLLSDILTEWLARGNSDAPEDNLKLIGKFKGFSTYFKNYHNSRKNIYTKENKATAIAYRLVDQNLPKFLDNQRIIERVKNESSFVNKLKSLVCDIGGYDFSQVMTQCGIEKYNSIINGHMDENNIKTEGINQLINEYNQSIKVKNERVPLLKTLYKQILSDDSNDSQITDNITNDKGVFDAVISFCQRLGLDISYPSVLKSGVFTRMKGVFEHISEFNQDGVFFNANQLNMLSSKIFGDWEGIRLALRSYIKDDHVDLGIINKNTEKYKKEQEKWLKQEQFSLYIIQKAIDISMGKDGGTEMSVSQYYKSLIGDENSPNNLITSIKNKFIKFTEMYIKYLDECHDEDKYIPLRQDKDGADSKNVSKVAVIKNLLDELFLLYNSIKIFKLSDIFGHKDEHFYSEFEPIADELHEIVSLYNRVRNYLTQKPYSLEKIKLNFENQELLGGWDVNKEKDYRSVLFRKDNIFYLGIIDKKFKVKDIFKNTPEDLNDECYDKMEYKLLPDPKKMLPKVFFSEKGKKNFRPSVQILEKYKNGTHKTGTTFSLQDCHQLIDFFKDAISRHKDWKNFNFDFSETKTYHNINDFYIEVAQQGYKIDFRKISEKYIDSIVEQGSLYLFKIYSKDFSTYSTGTKNLHTLYWNALFSPDNLAKVVYKLNGKAEMFFRKKSIKIDKPTHPKGEQISDIVKDKRFTEDKYLFHVPITINFKAQNNTNINPLVQNFIKKTDKVCFIGIDRGETNLLYISVVDLDGKILHQGSLNNIATTSGSVDYHKLLNDKAKKREEARLSWGTIKNIKELKSGYLSQAIHQIVLWMMRLRKEGYIPFIVMEQLNSGFKNSRVAIETQIYQKFEQMMIDKFNFLALKNPGINEPGIFNALQLANEFTTTKDLEWQRQNGFIFYVSPFYTSKIDPVTGFVDFLRPKYQNNLANAQKFMGKFDKIYFNKDNNWFEFEFDYVNFTDKANGIKTKWTICTTNQKRYVYNSKSRAYDPVDVTCELKNLFSEYHIDYTNSDNLVKAIASISSKDFFEKLFRLLRITLALRYKSGLRDNSNLNSGGDQDRDYILSPVSVDDKGKQFFDSRDHSKDSDYPCDSDANGAYNIAQKGVIMFHKIKNASTDLKDKDLAISNKEWLGFIQERSKTRWLKFTQKKLIK